MSDPSHPDYETPSILSDSPLAGDDSAHFHFDAFAATLARLIADKSARTPMTIGVSGRWGAGKTSLLRRLQAQLDQTACLLERGQPEMLDFANPTESPASQFRFCRTVWFNAWKYAEEDALLVALVRVIVQSMAADGLVNQVIAKLLDPSYPRRDVVETVLSWFSLKTPVGDLGLSAGKPVPTVFAEKAALLDQFNEAFDRLAAAWVNGSLTNDRIDPSQGVLVVLIDDLDRCLPKKTVQVLEAIKLFLDRPGCIFVLGADCDMVRLAVESHYKNENIAGQNAADYLDKIIQLRFELPPVSDEAMQEFLSGQPVSPELLAEWRTLLAAAEVNPRRVKAVLNDIDLQWRMLVNSGQAGRVARGDFIRWSALWRVAPLNFKEKLTDLDDLELRLKFIKDALRWGLGEEPDETLQRTFQEYEKDGRRLRRVLRQVRQFGPQFDAQTLKAFLYLTAPPARAAPPIESEPLAAKESAQPIEKHPLPRGEVGGIPAPSPDRQIWAGIEFVRVPAGKFLIGSKDDNPLADEDEKPQHALELPEFWIGRFPVANAQFESFVQASGYRTTAEQMDREKSGGRDWRHPRGPESDIKAKANHPVVQVSWQDAQAFCHWLNEAYGSQAPAGRRFRLPSEAEWEKAARGEYANEWPWGDQEPDENLCNFGNLVGDTSQVGAYSPQGDSPYGAADMAGNVWEWTHTEYKKYPYRPNDGREQETKTSSVRIVRGGSWCYSRNLVRCAYRRWVVPGYFFNDLGFRLVLPH